MGSGASNQNQVQATDNHMSSLKNQGTDRSVQNLTTDNTRSISSHAKSVKVDKRTKETGIDPVHKTPIESINHLSKSNSDSSFVAEQKITRSEKEVKPTKDALHQRINQLEKELAANESQKMDLQEKIQLLEERIENKSQLPENHQNNDETLHAKDQYILKLQADSQAAQIEANKLRLKLKKRIRGLNNQLHEIRQEASITQMELKSEITRLNDQLKAKKSQSSMESGQNMKESANMEDNASHSKVIVELSNQLSEQTAEIADLLNQVSQKNQRIEELESQIENKTALSSTSSPTVQPSKMLPPTSTDRLRSSRRQRVMKQYDSETVDSQDHIKKNTPSRQSFTIPQPLERQSTALSDSDSEWEMESIPSHTRSAPTGSRVKSAMSIAKSDDHKGSMASLNGDDDSIIHTVSKSPISHQDKRQQASYKSSLRNHLEKSRNQSQMHSLMGPSLAFVNKTDQFSDTSCEPTPRHPDSRFTSKLVKPMRH